MAHVKHLGEISMSMTSIVKWFQENLLHPIGFMQLGAVGVSYLIAWFFAKKAQQYLEKDIEKVEAYMRFVLRPAHIAIVLKYSLWLLPVWFLQVLSKNLSTPVELLQMALNLILVLMVLRFASFYIKSAFWSRFVYVISIIYLSLRIFKLWGPTVQLLNSMVIHIGGISVSLWGLIEAIVVFIVLWLVAGGANRFIGHWLANFSHLTYSDRTLIQRVVNAATGAMVILVALRAAGVHMAAIAVTGGAFGFAIGIGLQKIGANLVSGIMLLSRKPIKQGDVVAFQKSLMGASWGWITAIGLMYVRVATRDGVLLLVPNEHFVTQKIENLSYDNDLVRVHIPFGISYASDLKKAITLAVDSALSIDRVLKTPEPECRTIEFGESTVNMELRVWINDPKNGMANFKNAVLLAVWDSFHANGIEIAFPQRDLHIKSVVPLQVSRDNRRPFEKDSQEVTDHHGAPPK